MLWLLIGCGVVPAPHAPARIPDGQALFEKTWTPAEGLGPHFNKASCADCHPGGGATADNVTLIDGAVLHNHATIPGYDEQRSSRLAVAEGELISIGYIMDDDFGCAGSGAGFRPPTALVSRRNTPALWGIGRIESIPDEAILAGTGRVSRDAEGRIGRLGWKGDVVTVADFVDQACVNELGLTGGEITAADRAEMADFVTALPAPAPPVDGRAVFERFGCATCHTPDLGGVSGIFSDLMLHDMGEQLSDATGTYGLTPPDADVVAVGSGHDPAGAQEWRTPPLWGVADTAPYMHDGSAEDLRTAIHMHQGEGRAALDRWLAASLIERDILIDFLESLEGPES